MPARPRAVEIACRNARKPLRTGQVGQVSIHGDRQQCAEEDFWDSSTGDRTVEDRSISPQGLTEKPGVGFVVNLDVVEAGPVGQCHALEGEVFPTGRSRGLQRVLDVLGLPFAQRGE